MKFQKFRIWKISQFPKTAISKSISKIPKIFNLENSKNFQFKKLLKFIIYKLPKIRI